MKRIRPLMAIMAFVFASGVVCAEDSVNLAYEPHGGAEWTMNSVIDAKVPIVGNKHIEISYDLSCIESSDEGSIVELSVPEINYEGAVFGPVDASFNLSPYGDVSSLSSDDLNDPQIGPLLKNVGIIFPQLPGGFVTEGAGWTAREILYLPELGKMKMPSKIRLDGAFNYIGVSGGLHEVSISYKEADGDIKVSLKGKCFFDSDSGIVTEAEVTGTVKVKRFFKWFTIPVLIKATKK